MEKFNAFENLKDFNPAEEYAFAVALNGLVEGETYDFFKPDTPIVKNWRRKPTECLVTDTLIPVIPEWLARSVVLGSAEADTIITNYEMDDKYHCVKMKWADKENVKALYDFVSVDNPNFPRVRIVRMLPVAISRKKLIASNNVPVLNLYKREFGKAVRDMDVEFLPSFKEFTNSVDGTKYIRQSLVAVVQIL